MAEQNSQQNQAAEQSEQATAFEYQLLAGHQRTDGTYKSGDQLRTEYVRLSDEIVRHATEGVYVTDKETSEAVQKPVDYIVWLDKSARPVSWLVNDLWPILAQNADGTIPEKPQSRFVNIDREQWIDEIDPQGRGIADVAGIKSSVIRSLRSIFLENPNDRQNGLTEDIDTAPTQFDGKTVLIVDEVLSSGRTLDYACKFFERAFPEADVAGTHWMGKLTTRGTATGNADIPVWYSDRTPLGRGIGDRNPKVSLKSENSVQRLGAHFLSVALGPDALSKQLRTELHQLAEDTREGKVFVEPSMQRDFDDYDERAMRLNGLSSFDDYKAQKQQHDAA